MQTTQVTENHNTEAAVLGRTGGRDSGATWRVVSILSIVIAVAALVAALTLHTSAPSTEKLASSIAAQADKGTYQAVTLTTGTVYYGHLTAKGGALILNDVYYLNGATQQNPSGSLVKRGAELYAPKGAMAINPTLVVQVDNVGADSVVMKGITQLASK